MVNEDEVQGCLIALSRNEKKNLVYLIDASQIGSLKVEDLTQICYSKRNSTYNIFTVIKASPTIVILREAVVNRDFGGIGALVEGLNSKKITYNGKGFEYAN